MARADVKNLSFAQGEFMIDRVRVTASAPELNYNDGALPGQVVAEKTIVADTDGMVLGLRAPAEVITDNRVVSADESGLVLIADAADLNVTLPDTAAGFVVTVIVKHRPATLVLKSLRNRMTRLWATVSPLRMGSTSSILLQRMQLAT